MLQTRLRFTSFVILCAVLTTAFVPRGKISNVSFNYKPVGKFSEQKLKNEQQRPFSSLTTRLDMTSKFTSLNDNIIIINVNSTIEFSSISQQGKIGLLVGLGALAY